MEAVGRRGARRELELKGSQALSSTNVFFVSRFSASLDQLFKLSASPIEMKSLKNMIFLSSFSPDIYTLTRSLF